MPESLTETMRLLVVSRESAILRPIWAIAESHSWQVENAVSAWDAMERIQSAVAPHLLVLDVPRGDGDSVHILRWMRRLRPELPILVLCFPEDTGRKAQAIRLGAHEVLTRPIDEEQLESVIRRYVISSEMAAEMVSEDIEAVGPEAFFISAGPVSQKLRAQAELLAEADVPVLIVGEKGSGRDTVARLIHKLSIRSGFKFLKVNCADMPVELLEAELFGSGRNSDAGRGKLERAEKGTVFLDEVTEMPLSLQARLVKVFRDKSIPPSGSNFASPVDVRLLASTSCDIERALAEGKLREDLYYRLSAFTVQVPPLRQRKGEIAVLLRHFMHRLARHYGLPAREFSSTVLESCQRHAWPGNLTELEGFVKRYLVAGDSEVSFHEIDGGPNGVNAERKPSEHKVESKVARSSEAELAFVPKSLKSLIQSVKSEAERSAIAAALQKTGWNRKAAARLLQVSYRSLLYKIEQYEMSGPPLSISASGRPGFVQHGSTDKGNGNGKAS
ncbi:MAG TPA: sigma-54 dependent transcriptional regulator [Silvibacterium sp.]|nr:sigma-54 dependent transcriptional regulator [Silvibacterium sp.]